MLNSIENIIKTIYSIILLLLTLIFDYFKNISGITKNEQIKKLNEDFKKLNQDYKILNSKLNKIEDLDDLDLELLEDINFKLKNLNTDDFSNNPKKYLNEIENLQIDVKYLAGLYEINLKDSNNNQLIDLPEDSNNKKDSQLIDLPEDSNNKKDSQLIDSPKIPKNYDDNSNKS